MTILHLVHEGNADGLAARWRLFRRGGERGGGRRAKATSRRALRIRAGWRRRRGSRRRRARGPRRRRRPAALMIQQPGFPHLTPLRICQ